MDPGKQEPTTVPNAPPSTSTAEESASATGTRAGAGTGRGRGHDSGGAAAPATEGGPAARERGRGRARGRARGRRVVPRQVARRKTTSGQVPKSLTGGASEGPAGRGGRGRGRGRGRGDSSAGRGRGRGAGGSGSAPGVLEHAPNAMGLGQIAPPRQGIPGGGRGSGVASSGGGMSSRRSSAMSSGAASSSYSIGVNVDGMSLASGDGMGGMTDADMGSERGGENGENNDKGDKKDGKTNAKTEPVFSEHVEQGYDSEDDMPDDSFDMRNRDIAPYAGMLTDGGLLLPVSLPGLRSLPEKFDRFIIDDKDDDEKPVKDDDGAGMLGEFGDGKKEELKVEEKAKIKSEAKQEKRVVGGGVQPGAAVGSAKAEPMELDAMNVDSIQPPTAGATDDIQPTSTAANADAKEQQPGLAGSNLRAAMFPKGSAAYRILSSPPGDLALMQLPGLLPLAIASADRERMVKAKAKAPKLSSVAEAVAASERLRALGVDVRQVGQPGQGHDLAKLKVYRSGRVQLVLNNGGALDVEPGIRPRVNQQVVMVNCKDKTCEELANSVETWLVAVPALDNET